MPTCSVNFTGKWFAGFILMFLHKAARFVCFCKNTDSGKKIINENINMEKKGEIELQLKKRTKTFDSLVFNFYLLVSLFRPTPLKRKEAQN